MMARGESPIVSKAWRSALRISLLLPLVLMPGEGSVIYRGLATAIVGGMTCSLFFTLLMLPSLLRLGRAKRATQPLVEATPEPVT